MKKCTLKSKTVSLKNDKLKVKKISIHHAISSGSIEGNQYFDIRGLSCAANLLNLFAFARPLNYNFGENAMLAPYETGDEMQRLI